jgi:hypothetical protein
MIRKNKSLQANGVNVGGFWNNIRRNIDFKAIAEQYPI